MLTLRMEHPHTLHPERNCWDGDYELFNPWAWFIFLITTYHLLTHLELG